ncbi:hypothetical protein OIU76_024448 [Salix suchowensis]|nr:hypothetical protein OIU76_024448 [Salix suchowensis]
MKVIKRIQLKLASALDFGSFTAQVHIINKKILPFLKSGFTLCSPFTESLFHCTRPRLLPVTFVPTLFHYPTHLMLLFCRNTSTFFV